MLQEILELAVIHATLNKSKATFRLEHPLSLLFVVGPGTLVTTGRPLPFALAVFHAVFPLTTVQFAVVPDELALAITQAVEVVAFVCAFASALGASGFLAAFKLSLKCETWGQ